MIDKITSPLLARTPHGFFGRRGGVSVGLYASLNVGLGSDDLPEAVRENRRRASHDVIAEAPLLTLHQIHSATVVVADSPWSDEARPHADGVVTARPGTLLGILTADCVPVLFADPARAIIGAAHAGWKGALGGVTDHLIDAMCALGACRDDIVAAIGPCIGRPSYEVSDAFARQFEAQDPANERFFTGGRLGHQHFDIEAYVINRLRAAGVQQIDASHLDTYAHPERFFSYRRSCHAGEIDYGRQISIIGLTS